MDARVGGANQAEEEVGVMAVEWPEADLVDDGQRAVEVALGLEPGRGHWGIGPQLMHEVVEHEVRGAEPVLDGLDP